MSCNDAVYDTFLRSLVVRDIYREVSLQDAMSMASSLKEGSCLRYLSPVREARRKKRTNTYFLNVRNSMDIWYGLYCPLRIQNFCMYTEDTHGKKTRIFEPVTPNQDEKGFILFSRPVPFVRANFSFLGIEYEIEEQSSLGRGFFSPSFICGMLSPLTRIRMPTPDNVSISTVYLRYSDVFYKQIPSFSPLVSSSLASRSFVETSPFTPLVGERPMFFGSRHSSGEIDSVSTFLTGRDHFHSEVI